jgi:DNA topoisomerase-1
MEEPTSPTDAKRKITVCVKAVAGLLGNTPTVCRASYVHPKVFELYETRRDPQGPARRRRPQASRKALIRVLDQG